MFLFQSYEREKYKYIRITKLVGWLLFYGISTLEGYLMPNPVYIYIYIYM